MEPPQLPARPGAGLLAEAFPERLRADSTAAAEAVLRRLHQLHETDRFPVFVESQTVLIPGRLYFVADADSRRLDPRPRLMARCLETRSNDGFHRQRALRHLLSEVEPWSVAFIVALIGEYVIEILSDIDQAMTPDLVEAMTIFARANPFYWNLTRQRVASYWNAYYRFVPRSDYVGFRLVGRIDAALEAAKPG